MSAPYYADESVTLWHGDALEVLRELPDASVDAVVTDPPYGLEFMGKGWDGADGFRRSLNSADVARSNVFGRASRTSPEYRAGSLFQDWCTAWATECLRVLKPGGHMLAFGGTRTWHRLASAVEDAGFEIRDSIAWLYGSGFPKSLDVSKAIDKRPGISQHPVFAAHLAERRQAAGLSRADVSERVVGTRTGACWNWEHHQFPEAKWWPALRDLLDLDEQTWGPVIAEAERQKIGTKAGNRLAVAPGQGMDRGAIDLDVTTHATDAAQQWAGWGTALKPAFEPIVVARKPLAGTVAANVLAHGTGALNIDACRVASSEADKAAINAKHAGMDTGTYERRPGASLNLSTNPMPLKPAEAHAGGRWPTNVVLDDTQAAELDRQSGVLTSGGRAWTAGDEDTASWRNLEGRDKPATRGDYARSGDSGGASRFFPTFRYEAKARTEERPRVGGIAHPTVKPLDLMRWLVRLVTPPGGTVLEPFAGSGTTAEACVIEGFHCIAIEREADYLPLIRARLEKPIQAALDFGEAVS